MAKLIDLTIASLDGYVADEHGDFAWALPDGVSLGLELLEEYRFTGGMTYLGYGITGGLRGSDRNFKTG